MKTLIAHHIIDSRARVYAFRTNKVWHQLKNLAHSKRKKLFPVVLTRREFRSSLSNLDGWH